MILSLGVISSSPAIGEKSLDVTQLIRTELARSRPRTRMEFRLRPEAQIDGDRAPRPGAL